VVRLWAIVLVTNLAGAAAVAWVLGHTGTFTADVRAVFTLVGRQAVAGDPWTVLLRAVFAGWLIALMVWMLPFSESARVTVVLIITYVVALGGFPHIIAGGVDVFYLLGIGLLTPERAWLGWLLPTFAGNMIGGLALVAALNHAQVMSGRET
jgi:formate/nitrite transporter FocA (FNT family)